MHRTTFRILLTNSLESDIVVNTPEMIRPARIEDCETIAQFTRQMAWETENLRLDAAVVSEGVRVVLENPAHGFYVVATQNEQVIGCLMITYEWSDWRNGVKWWLQSVYVEPNNRRRGIFGKLYKYVVNLAAEKDNICGIRLYVDKENTKAMEAYRSLGMHDSNYLIYEVELTTRDAR